MVCEPAKKHWSLYVGQAANNKEWSAGIVLAYSNSVAGKLADYTQQQGLGNIGCFYGGIVAILLSGTVLLLSSKFGDLGKEELIATKKKPLKA